ncbi:MAG: hypothetical protein HOV80_19730 [Polyangiaceae bacterium]|nr:hypothetical protein [Polyangiaceae bacterium]
MTQQDEIERPGWEEAAERLEVVLTNPVFLTGLRAPLVGIAVAPHVMAYATLDGSLLPAALATTWEKSFAEILARAIANLERAPPRLVTDGGLARLETRDGCVASRVLLPGFFDAFEEVVGGRPICAIPEAGTCLLANANDDDAVIHLHEAAFDAWRESSAPLSPVVYQPAGEGFAPLELHEGHPATPAARRAAALLLASAYADQAASFEGADDRPLFAPFEIAPHEELGVVTCTVAVRGVEALLPETDLVMLREAEDEAGARLVPRATLERARLLVPVPDFDPPRFGLVAFPAEGTDGEPLG